MERFNWIKKHWIPFTVGAVLSGALVMFLLTARSLSNRAQPRVGPVVESVYGIGTVTSRHTFQLKLGVSDTLARLFVEEGASVKKGQALVSFMDNHLARAPFDGVVTSLPYKEGETVFPQFAVLTLTDLKDPYVVVSLEQSGALRVKRIQPALLSFESLRGQKLEGTVSAIYPKSGEFYVNIEVPKIPPEILVGMTCDVAIQVARKENVLQIPMVAVDKGVVTVLRNGIPKKITVKLGAMDGTWAEVTDHSIQPDDSVVLPGKR